ncbi:P-loop containing nucleoside triphosphate hydrolase protein [Aspergillus taichungensis]|uniref:P-loop containing nucleoside triphosphate hydrolase protein n=1 Tax=Aspergillus taichungensis TaxID=482145 RepID=A0A2J5HWQ0_9EURO|nr:P-loop containing nucleoside triphosphate hydrolase protein [Aspergillus taichungensis]
MEAEYTRLADTIRTKASAHKKPRLLVAMAGIPGSGKTTTASAVAQRLNSDPSPIRTVLIPMDGFHLPRATLDQLPNREEAYIRRGAPWTFDATGFLKFVHQLRQWAEQGQPSIEKPHKLYAPSFDHETKDPVENDIGITDDTTILILEGNYVLLDEPQWREVAPLVDLRVFVDADPTEARDRIARRHVQVGIEETLADAYRRADSNDCLNAQTIREKLIPPDIVVRSVADPQ